MISLLYLLYALLAAIEISILCYVFVKLCKYHSFSIKDTAIYPIILCCSFLILFLGFYRYDGGDALFSFTKALSASVKLLAVQIDISLLSLLFNADAFLFALYLGIALISALCLFSLALSLFKSSLRNLLRKMVPSKRRDYYFSLNEDLKTYLKNLSREQRKRSVVVLDCTGLNSNSLKEGKILLDELKVKYVLLPIGEKMEYLEKTMRSLSKKADTLVSFYKGDEEAFRFTLAALNLVASEAPSPSAPRRETKYVVYCSYPQTLFLSRLVIDENQEDKGKGRISITNKHEIMAKQFICEHPFSKYVQSRINDDATINEDFEINLYMIGFGDANQTLLRDILIQNQFAKKVRTKDGKLLLQPYRFQTYVYEKQKNFSCTPLSDGIFKYRKSDFKPENYFPLIEDYVSNIHIFPEKDVTKDNVCGEIYDRIRSSKARRVTSFFIISIGDDALNFHLAHQLQVSLSHLNGAEAKKEGRDFDCVFFFRNKSGLAPSQASGKVIGFASDPEVLSFDNFINDALSNQMILENHVYNQTQALVEGSSPGQAEEWAGLKPHKKRSNLYSVLSITHKEFLLKIRDDNRKEVIERYDSFVGKTDYFEVFSTPQTEFNVRDVLAFIEHERWNAYQIAFGSLPMKKSMFYEISKEGKVKARSDDLLYHANITTMEGLIEFYHASLAIDPSGAGADVIKYDYNVMDSYKSHFRLEE